MLREHQAAELGLELHKLTPRDGFRLANIIAKLRRAVEREPQDLTLHAALINSLVLAGRSREAHAAIARSLALWRAVPSVPPQTTLNVIAGLNEAGLVDESKELIASLDRRHLDQLEDYRRTLSAAQLAARHGEIDWFAGRYPTHPLCTFFDVHGLRSGWQAQQQAVERQIRSRVAAFSSHLMSVDGEERLVIDYFTDATRYSEIDALQNLIWDVVGLDSPVLIHVNFIVHGPEIPLVELQP